MKAVSAAKTRAGLSPLSLSPSPPLPLNHLSVSALANALAASAASALARDSSRLASSNSLPCKAMSNSTTLRCYSTLGTLSRVLVMVSTPHGRLKPQIGPLVGPRPEGRGFVTLVINLIRIRDGHPACGRSLPHRCIALHASLAAKHVRMAKARCCRRFLVGPSVA